MSVAPFVPVFAAIVCLAACATSADSLDGARRGPGQATQGGGDSTGGESSSGVATAGSVGATGSTGAQATSGSSTIGGTTAPRMTDASPDMGLGTNSTGDTGAGATTSTANDARGSDGANHDASDAALETCGAVICGVDRHCCNPSCGICAASGASCSAAPCGDAAVDARRGSTGGSTTTGTTGRGATSGSGGSNGGSAGCQAYGVLDTTLCTDPPHFYSCDPGPSPSPSCVMIGDGSYCCP